ncbi:hypothetical protein [Cognatishimia sp.]|uniref:hypothetical protein n=1 Tax=Cognatishimia sp. TaxID=2211648 RepID=UPI0035169715|nr:hypothetical protein [Cognatishimia sp.]
MFKDPTPHLNQEALDILLNEGFEYNPSYSAYVRFNYGPHPLDHNRKLPEPYLMEMVTYSDKEEDIDWEGPGLYWGRIPLKNKEDNLWLYNRDKLCLGLEEPLEIKPLINRHYCMALHETFLEANKESIHRSVLNSISF